MSIGSLRVRAQFPAGELAAEKVRADRLQVPDAPAGGERLQGLEQEAVGAPRCARAGEILDWSP